MFSFAIIFFIVAAPFALILWRMKFRSALPRAETNVLVHPSENALPHRIFIFVIRTLFVGVGVFFIFLSYQFWNASPFRQENALIVLVTLSMGSLFMTVPWGISYARLRKLFFIFVGLVLLMVLASFFLASLNTGSHGRGRRNARRISDIKQIQLALELYFDDTGHGFYPQAHTVCDATKSYGLEVLRTYGYIAQIPRDPLDMKKCYFYATPSLMQGTTTLTYHLATELDDKNHSLFRSDRDCDSRIVDGCKLGMSPYINGFDGANDAINLRYDVTP